MAFAQPIEIVGRDFYSSDYWKNFLNESQSVVAEDELGGRYYDPESESVKNYTKKDLLQGGAHTGRFIQEDRTIDQTTGATVSSENRVLDDFENYSRLLTLSTILNNENHLADAIAAGATEEELREDFHENAYNNYLKLLRLNDPERSGLGGSRDYEPQESPDLMPEKGGLVLFTKPLEPIIKGVVEPVVSAFHDMNEDQRAQLQLRGVKPRYIEEYYQKYNPLPKEYLTRVAQSPTFPTPNEYLNIIKPYDPVVTDEATGETYPNVIEIAPGKPEEGLLIQSKFNPIDEETGKPAWLPVEAVQPVEMAFRGMEFPELLFGDYEPLVDELEKFGAQEGPVIVGGMGLLGMITRFARRRINKRLKDTASETELGRIPGEKTGIEFFPRGSKREAARDIFLSSLGIASTEAATKFALLAMGASGREQGYENIFDDEGNVVREAVQPDLQFDRALRDSQALFSSALMYGSMGDIAIRSFGALWGKLTGRPPSNELIDQMIVEARALGDKIRGIKRGDAEALPEELDKAQQERLQEVLDDPQLSPSVQEKELSIKEQRELSTEAADKLAEILKNRRRTLGQLSQSDIIQALEELLLTDLGPKLGAPLENIAAENAMVLDVFYQRLVRGLDLDPTADTDYLSKQMVNDIFRGIQGERLLKDLSEEEAKIAQAQADGALSALIPPTTRKARAEAAEDVQEQVTTSQSQLFPDSKSRLLLMRQAEIQDAQNTINDVLDQPLYNDPKFGSTLPTYIKDSLRKFLDANKESGTIFGTMDAAEASEVIRTMLPNREADDISIKMMLGEARDEAKTSRPLLKHKRFTQADLIRTRDNLASVFNGHPNPVVRERGAELLADFEKAINAGFRKMYREVTGDSPEGKTMDQIYEKVGLDYQQAASNFNKVRQELNTRFLVDTAKLPENEIGKFIRTHNPDDVRGLVNMLSRQDGGLEKLERIKELVIESISREVKDPITSGPNIGKGEATRLAKLLQNNEEQLRALFPEDFVNFSSFPALMETSRKAIQESKVNIRALEKELEKLADPEGNVPQITDVLDSFFGLGASQARTFDQSTAQKALINIGNLAEKFPDLRKAMQGYFGEEILIRQLQMPSYRQTPRGKRMRGPMTGQAAPFNFDNLKRMFLDPYNSDRSLAKALEPVIGKELAMMYAKDLRILARQINKQKGFSGSPINEYATKVAGQVLDESAKPALAQTLGQIRKIIYGPLNLTSTRLGVGSEFAIKGLDELKLRYLADIVANPNKLHAYLAAEQRKLPAITMLKIMHAISEGREANVGSEANDDEVERLKLEIENLTKKSRSLGEKTMRWITE